MLKQPSRKFTSQSPGLPDQAGGNVVEDGLSYYEELDEVHEQYNEDDNHSEQVANFLKNLEEAEKHDISQPYLDAEIPRPPTGGANLNWEGNAIGMTNRSRVYAVNELKRMSPEKGSRNVNSQSAEFNSPRKEGSSRALHLQ